MNVKNRYIILFLKNKIPKVKIKKIYLKNYTKFEISLSKTHEN
jgi:hypothetical protein